MNNADILWRTMSELLNNARSLTLRAVENAYKEEISNAELEIVCHEMKMANIAIAQCKDFNSTIFKNVDIEGISKKGFDNEINNLIEMRRKACIKLFSNIKFFIDIGDEL